MAPSKKKKPALKPKLPAPKEARTKDHKTSKDPWEASRSDESWEVEAVQVCRAVARFRCPVSPFIPRFRGLSGGDAAAMAIEDRNFLL